MLPNYDSERSLVEDLLDVALSGSGQLRVGDGHQDHTLMYLDVVMKDPDKQYKSYLENTFFGLGEETKISTIRVSLVQKKAERVEVASHGSFSNHMYVAKTRNSDWYTVCRKTTDRDTASLTWLNHQMMVMMDEKHLRIIEDTLNDYIVMKGERPPAGQVTMAIDMDLIGAIVHPSGPSAFSSLTELPNHSEHSPKKNRWYQFKIQTMSEGLKERIESIRQKDQLKP